MLDSGWFFLYTPVPWLALMYAGAYRHNLSRFVKPFRDRGDLRTWWSVSVFLELMPAEAPEPPRRIWRSGSFIALIVAVVVSLLWLTPIVSWVWYYLALLQIMSALILFLALHHLIGRLPAKPYCDTLPYPRLGSRVRHLRPERRTASSRPKAAAEAPIPQQTNGAGA